MSDDNSIVVGPSSDGPTGPERAAADRIRDSLGKVLAAATAAAEARLMHAEAISHPMQYRAEMFGIAQARRQADADAGVALDKYINMLAENAKRTD